MPPPGRTYTLGPIALPGNLFEIPNAWWSVYVDDDWGSLGGTRIDGQVEGFRWTLSDFIMPGRFMDGRLDLDFSRYIFGRRVVDLTMDIVLDPSSSGFGIEELAHKKVKDTRFVRLQADGPAFAAPDAAFNPFMRLDLSSKHVADSMIEFGPESNRLDGLALHLRSFEDAASLRDLSIAVQNDVDSFP